MGNRRRTKVERERRRALSRVERFRKRADLRNEGRSSLRTMNEVIAEMRKLNRGPVFVCSDCNLAYSDGLSPVFYGAGAAEIGATWYRSPCPKCGQPMRTLDPPLEAREGDLTAVHFGTEGERAKVLALVELLRAGSFEPDALATVIEERASWLQPLADFVRQHKKSTAAVLAFLTWLVPTPLEGRMPWDSAPTSAQEESITREDAEQLRREIERLSALLRLRENGTPSHDEPRQ